MTIAAGLAGRTILITGATDGLGRALAIELAANDARLLIHGRDRQRCERILAELTAAGARSPAAFVCDFSDLAGIAQFAREVREQTTAIDVLVSNAGIGLSRTRSTSRQGVELTLQVNALAGDLLIQSLLPMLVTSRARIVLTASAGQWPLDLDDFESTRSWNGAIAYGRSKLAQMMLAFELGARATAASITINAVHPASLMPTKLVNGLMTPRSSLAQGVRSVRRMLEDPALDGVTGRYFNELTEERAHDQAYDVAALGALRRYADRIYCQLGLHPTVSADKVPTEGHCPQRLAHRAARPRASRDTQNRPVVAADLQDVDERDGTVVPRRGERLERR